MKRRLVLAATLMALLILATCWWLATTIGELE